MHNAATGVTMEFKYNAEGIRTQKVKKVNSTVTETTDYILKGKHIVAMKKNTDTYYFTYDASGKPATVNFNGANYTYVKNLQGDIVGILDASGNLVVEYKYDAWGAPISISSESTTVDDLAFDNPFRYRGYVWDDETGLYYLRSRYYNPKYGRFLNSDSLLSNNKRLLTTNIYVYCGNSSIIYSDPNGKSFLGVLGFAMLVGLTATLSGCSTSKSVKDAPDLDREKSSRSDYNCFGNAIGKQVYLDPTGYEYGMTPYTVYELVKSEVGEENIELHDSIEAEISADEYMVALNCGIDDYHFIVYDNGVIYNKQGNLDLVVGCTLDCINSQEWYTHFHTDEQLAIYGTVVEKRGVCYNEGPIFFSINRDWSN